MHYLRSKINEVERCSSKDTLIFRNLQFVSNVNVTTDEVNFINEVFHVDYCEADLVAFHELGKLGDPREPPAIIAKFIYFNQKSCIWGRKKLLGEYKNQLNNRSVFIYGRLIKTDKGLLDYALRFKN